MRTEMGNRRDFLKTVYAGTAGVALGGCANIPHWLGGKAVSQRPNIILIMSDDMGYSDIGCYGGEIHTPNLDQLAEKGLRFTQFYNSARCCPTRACLLTGLYPHQAGMGHMTNDYGLPGYTGGINGPCVTIAEAIKTAGYATYMSGKWHVTRHIKPKSEADKYNWPLQRGFDRFYGTIFGAGSFYDPVSLTRGNQPISPTADPQYQPETFYYTDAISDHAVRFVREHNTPGPFFMYVAYTAAHWPMHALPQDIAKYKGKYDGGYKPIREARFERMKKMGLIDPSWQLSDQVGHWDQTENQAWEARCMEVYAAMVDSMDQGIGRIVEALKKTGQFDNTLILFLQDNGGCAESYDRSASESSAPDTPLTPMAPDELQQDMIPKKTRDGQPVRMGPGAMPGPADTYISYGRAWANVSNTPFREYKHWVHEGGIATPLIAHWPGGIVRHGELESQPGHLIDIMATCVDVAGAEYPTTYKQKKIIHTEGVSLVATFDGRSLPDRAIYFEHEGNRAMRMDKWKLVAKGPEGPWELYDMTADRTETNNLAEKEPDYVNRMAAIWEKWAKRAKVVPWPWEPKPKKKSE